TEVRGFYGAVCAKRGSRGIFATTSDFHTSAKDFINGLDDLVGINGDRVFALSIECAHGIKKVGEKLEIDERIFI
ncbi:MAG: restriction endonuclease, partial [Clostridia bacterium]|nr:restriction endonuclease [Clostridia bacterium]